MLAMRARLQLVALAHATSLDHLVAHAIAPARCRNTLPLRPQLERPALLHVAFQALDAFQAKHSR